MSKILKFSAHWCGPCKVMSKQLGLLKNELSDTVIEEIDISENTELKTKYDIRSIPTLIRLDVDGVEVARSVGALTVSKLMEFIRGNNK